MLLLALQECCDGIPAPQVVHKSEDPVILIHTSAGLSGTELSFRLSPLDSQCPLANEVSAHVFKAPISSSISDLCCVIEDKLCPCSAEGEMQFFVRGMLLSKFATLRDAHSLWTVVLAPPRFRIVPVVRAKNHVQNLTPLRRFSGLPMTLHFRCMCACSSRMNDYVHET